MFKFELRNSIKKFYFYELLQVSEINPAALGEVSIPKNFLEEKNK